MEMSSSSIEQFPKRDASEATTRKIFKIKEFADTLLFLSHQCKFWPNFTEIRQYTYPINSFKEEGLSRKANASFRPPRICEHGTPYQRDMSSGEKPPANEITELPAFIVCKQELREKAIVLVTFSARTLLGGSHQ